MNKIKSTFSIRDLENLSGIKAHTIRIWERRYNILSPNRTGTNIRYYDLESLHKLLNVALLHRHGYKISKISRFPDDQIPVMVREIISRKHAGHHAINAFKLAMMNFNPTLFHQTYNSLLAEKSFRNIFYEIVIPLMEEVGLLWQSGTITPAHEHFITNLMTQKLLVSLEKIQTETTHSGNRVFVLFLPDGELHQLGLMYISYEIALHGHKCIYLGESVPTNGLLEVRNYFDNIIYITYFTVRPAKDEINGYVARICNDVLTEDSRLWLIGRALEGVDASRLPHLVKIFKSIPDLVGEL